jgi:pectinesterase
MTTYPQLRFLAQVISAGHAEQKYLAAFYRGLAFILRAQYDSGGWPQYAEPLRAGYYVNITYNDDAMIGVMEFLEDILNKAWFMGFVWEDPEVIAQVKAARDKGIECILNTQQRTDAEHGNVLTAWCQQHDPVTLAPADGRAYELPLLTPMESAEVVLYLMNIKNPGPRITRAIEGAAAWYKKTAKVGYITERIYDQKMINGDVRELIYTGNPQDMVWGRFYDLETGMQDVYTHRDGIKRYTFHETPYSTRHGYAFLNNRGMEVLAQYEVWRQRQPDKNYPQER